MNDTRLTQKPVVYKENSLTCLPVSHCPTCDECVNVYAYGREKVQEFCPYCGQALDWGVCVGDKDGDQTETTPSCGAIDQIKWERDVAISQLSEIGKGFAEKMDDVAKIVRCKDCVISKIHMRPSAHPMSVGFGRYCPKHREWVSEEHFCSDGTKRETESGFDCRKTVAVPFSWLVK